MGSLKTSERRAKIRQLLAERGTWGISQTSLAQEYNVSPSQIHDDIKMLLRESVEVDDLHDLKKNIFAAYKNVVRKAYKASLEDTNRIKDFVTAEAGFTKFLQNWAIIPKVPENVNIASESPEKFKEIMREVFK